MPRESSLARYSAATRTTSRAPFVRLTFATALANLPSRSVHSSRTYERPLVFAPAIRPVFNGGQGTTIVNAQFR